MSEMLHSFMVTNYIMIAGLLIIWMFHIGVYVQEPIAVSGKVNYKNYKQCYSWLLVLVIAVPLAIWAGTRGDFEDTSAYRADFHVFDASWNGIHNIITGSDKGKGFDIISILIKMCVGDNDVFYFIVLSAFMILCVICFYRRFSCMLPESVFLFVVSAEYYAWFFNGIRQFLAVSVLLIGYCFLVDRKIIRYLICVAIAATIHSTALVALLALLFVRSKPWKTMTIITIICVAAFMLFQDYFTKLLDSLLEDTEYSGDVALFAKDNGVNIVRVLVYAVPAVIAFFCRRQIDAQNDTVINFAINMSFLSLCFYIVGTVTSGIFIGRLPIYFSLWNYILLPWEINTLFVKSNRAYLNIAMVAAYIVYNIVEMNTYFSYYT